MTEREALKLALEALEVANSCVDGYYIPKGKTHLPEIELAITAIKEALAQPKQHQDWCASLTQMLMSMPPKPAPCNCKPKPEQEPCCYAGIAHDCHAGKGCRIAERMKAAQTEQEPVAWAKFSAKGNIIDLLSEPDDDYTPLYTTPPQRTWVGLTLDERIELAQDVDWAIGAYCEYAEKIEAKLRSKNESKN